MPPAPSGEAISYGPSRVPTASGISALLLQPAGPVLDQRQRRAVRLHGLLHDEKLLTVGGHVVEVAAADDDTVEQGHRASDLERACALGDFGGHQPAGISHVVDLFAVRAPTGIASGARRDLPLAARTGKRRGINRTLTSFDV